MTNTHRQRADREETIEWLRSRLADREVYVEDDDLAQEISDWIAQTFDVPAGDVHSYIEQELLELRSDHPMYHAAGLEDSSDAFPDECEGCEHYGTACPVLTRTRYVERRQRLKERLERDSEAAVKQSWRELAIDTDCQIIVDRLSKWEHDYASHLEDGWRLYRDVRDVIRPTSEVEQAKETVETTIGGGK